MIDSVYHLYTSCNTIPCTSPHLNIRSICYSFPLPSSSKTTTLELSSFPLGLHQPRYLYREQVEGTRKDQFRRFDLFQYLNNFTWVRSQNTDFAAMRFISESIILMQFNLA